MRALVAVLVAVLASASLAGQRAGDPAPELTGVLAAVATYLAAYESDIQAVVAEEEYSQQFFGQPGILSNVRQNVSRTLRSELLVLADPRYGTVTFRDVYQIDGRPVRDRDERLADLFAKPSASAAETARAITAASARFNLNVPGVSNNRTLNVPMAALLYLRGPFQSRSTFTVERVVTVRGRRAVILAFEERVLPRLIQSPSNLAMRGRAWIELATGRILETELLYDLMGREGNTEAKIGVVYDDDRASRLLLPVSMQETYAATLGGVLTTKATYSKFRRFSVDAATAFTAAPN